MHRDGSPAARRWPAVATAVGAMSIAAYTGFRMPSLWCTTLDAVSLFDGFHRRFLVGTLLRPLAAAANYSYWLFAGFSFAVLAGVLAVLLFAVARTQLVSRRLLVVAWLLLPSGGFVFHEVGQLDLVLYLGLFAALALMARGRIVAATCVMALAPCVHELAILTVIPVFGVVALRTLAFRRALWVTLLPALVNVVILLIPAAHPGAPDALLHTLAGANFPCDPGVLGIFTNTTTENWAKYSVEVGYVNVRPTALVAAAAFVGAWLCDRTLCGRGAGGVPAALVLAGSVLAIVAPAILIFGGSDSHRWAFLVTCNLFILLWLSLGARHREPAMSVLFVLATATMVLSHLPFVYFYPNAPRDLNSVAARRQFRQQLRDGSLFAMAPRLW
jgi:hypothetical protein